MEILGCDRDVSRHGGLHLNHGPGAATRTPSSSTNPSAGPLGEPQTPRINGQSRCVSSHTATLTVLKLRIFSLSWSAILCWDGLLPAVVAAIPVFTCYFLGRNHLGALLAAVMIPVFASLIRASVGPRHLQHAGSPIVLRQLFFAAAVAVLFAIELFSNIAQLSEPLPTEIWLIVAAAYFMYFGLIVLAMRPFPLCALTTDQQH